MSSKKRKLSPNIKFALNIFMTILGAIIFAVGLELMLIPNEIMDGGVVGLSIMSAKLFGIPSGVFILILNIPFFFLGYKQIGKRFTLITAIGVIVLSVVTVFLHNVAPLIDDKLLATIFGGMTLGVGVGLVMRFGEALDGTEILSLLLTKKLPFSVGQIVMFINVIIFTLAAFVFSPKQAMYSILAYYIASKTIDIVVSGMSETKAINIISKKSEEIGEAINLRLGRSVTYIKGEGGYMKEEYKILLTVVSKIEESKLHEIIQDTDPDAIVIGTISDTYGGSFGKRDVH